MARLDYAQLAAVPTQQAQRPPQQQQQQAALTSSGSIRWWYGMLPRAAPQSVPEIPRQVLPVSLEALALQSNAFRQVLLTTKHMQLTTSFLPNQSIAPQEAYAEADRLITVIRGSIQIDTFDPQTGAQDTQILQNGDACIVPHGTWHAIAALADSTLTNVYSPPQYEPGADEPALPVVPVQGTAISRTGYTNANAAPAAARASPRAAARTRQPVLSRLRPSSS